MSTNLAGPDGGAAADLVIEPMRRDQIAVLGQWAAAEGWNPGHHDIEIAWAVDPDAFIALRQGDRLIGGGTIISYAGLHGFMGLFIVHTDFRGEGLGTQLWHRRRDLLLKRLQPGASIGMDGVFAMVPFYERGGFTLAYRDLRYEGVAHGVADPDVVPLSEVPFAQLDSFDRRHVAAPRSAFLQRWVEQQGVHTVALTGADGALVGYGVARPCVRGYKIGPLFADTEQVAERLLDSLCAKIAGEFVQIDVPEVNHAGVAMAQRRGFTESFGCARMYLGSDPGLPTDRIFGVTSFEFG
ncbi:unannotated protein [freshwater metagenome]|jgi:GNAT superfamily N-acetyltransferase|uniref:Unannotated protein n=1 Tax=freshwater metagenome TaxID=449393 RepID=A0A6J6A534_9ZZZZ